MNDPNFYSKKDGRKLSPFVGTELLYDYLSKNLDSERTKAMQELIASSNKISDEIRVIQRSLGYLDELSRSDLSVELLDRVKAPTSYYQGFLKRVKFVDWPVGIKLGIEALFVSTLIFSSIIMIPWHRINNMNFASSRETLLFELEHEKPKGTGLESEVPKKTLGSEASSAAVTFQDEGAASNSSSTASTKTDQPDKPSTELAKPEQVKPGVNQASPVAVTDKSKKTQPLEPKPTSTPQAVVATESAAVIDEKQRERTSGKSSATQGYLYRGSISVTNLTVTSQKFVEKIASLGGRRAGEVELGWKKGDGTYFHFTIPEAKYETLMSYLNEYGKIKIQREKHERVMPDGIIRLIITVSEDKKHQ